MTKARIIKLTLSVFFTQVLIVFSHFSFTRSEGFSIESMLLLSVGGYIQIDQLIFIHVLIQFLPFFVFYLTLADYLQEDLRISGIYIFTRTARRAKWLNKKLSDLFLFSLICSAELILIPILISFIFKIPVNSYSSLIYIIVNGFILIVFSLFMWVICVNLIVLVLGEKIGILISFSVQMISLLLPFVSRENPYILMRLNITTNSMLTFHNDGWLIQQMNNMSIFALSDWPTYSIYEIPLVFSFFYFLLIDIVLILVCHIVIKKVEIC